MAEPATEGKGLGKGGFLAGPAAVIPALLDQGTAGLIGSPSMKTFISPASKGSQVSLVVNGAVTIMATLSLGVVTWEKSTITSSSDRRASANGYCRTR